MLMQGIWWDEPPLKALLPDHWIRRLHGHQIVTPAQFLLMPDLPAELKPIADRILLYKVATRWISEDKRTVGFLLRKVNGKIGSAVISRHFQRKEIQSLYAIVGNPLTGRIIAHRKVQLQRDEIRIELTADSTISDDCWVYLMPEAYMGIDQQYAIGDTPVLTRLSLKQKTRKAETEPVVQRPAPAKPDPIVERPPPPSMECCDDGRGRRTEPKPSERAPDKEEECEWWNGWQGEQRGDPVRRGGGQARDGGGQRRGDGRRDRGRGGSRGGRGDDRGRRDGRNRAGYFCWKPES
jgi:hypothetical protein